MFLKILSIALLFSVVYVLGVFLAPIQTDEIGKVLGIYEFNAHIRESKLKLDSVTNSALNVSSQS